MRDMTRLESTVVGLMFLAFGAWAIDIFLDSLVTERWWVVMLVGLLTLATVSLGIIYATQALLWPSGTKKTEVEAPAAHEGPEGPPQS